MLSTYTCTLGANNCCLTLIVMSSLLPWNENQSLQWNDIVARRLPPPYLYEVHQHFAVAHVRSPEFVSSHSVQLDTDNPECRRDRNPPGGRRRRGLLFIFRTHPKDGAGDAPALFSLISVSLAGGRTSLRSGPGYHPVLSAGAPGANVVS